MSPSQHPASLGTDNVYASGVSFAGVPLASYAQGCFLLMQSQPLSFSFFLRGTFICIQLVLLWFIIKCTKCRRTNCMGGSSERQ